MLIENVELTMSHIGLGDLNEYALLILFGNAHSHHLTMGVGITPNKIKDEKGLTLYPAYFMTHLKVPADSLLSSFKLWEHVQIGVDVWRFGETILDSCYILCRDEEIPCDASAWETDRFPSMKGNNLIVIDATESQGTVKRVSVPKPELIAGLPKLKKAPASIMRARNVRAEGFKIEAECNLKNSEPFIYHVGSDQDAAPGHSMIFAKFIKIMDHVEFEMLSRYISPGLQSEVIHHLSVLERETYYYGNCFSGETLEVYVHGNISECPIDYCGESLQTISAALLNIQFEIYQRSNKALLAMSNVKKVLALPSYYQDMVADVRRTIENLNRKL